MQLTEKQIQSRIECWQGRVISPWYLRPSQLEIYELLLREKFPFVQAARRFGKTNSILCFALEKLIQNPGWITRWCFPFKNQARDVLVAEMNKIQTHCPSELKFKYQTTDSVFINPQGSKLYIRGVNEDRGESARGPASNIIIADEYGFWNEPKYIIRSALFPQLEKQEGQWLVKASTPPPDLGHAYYEEREVAKRKNRFVSKIIYDNESLSPEELQIIIDESGGIESIPFRRERLCEDVGDPEMLVIPEFSETENVVDDDYPTPGFPVYYVGGDSGADDNTALLFAWYDFLKNEVVIDDEYVQNGRTSREITDFAKAKELEIWGEVKPRKRVYDADKQLIYDIWVDHNYHIQAPDKADKIASVHELRNEIQNRRFKIKKRCKNTIQQLKVGMWKDSRHSDFQRTEGLGHLDAIAAALYLNRSIERDFNPVPHNHGLSRQTHHITQSTTPLGKTGQTLNQVFGGKSRRFR
ncbi:MAG: hypothetical protein H0X02_01925 [Nitrosomonas sp.]|nr:hypothetical protein [Nitrosomonas sp.]